MVGQMMTEAGTRRTPYEVLRDATSSRRVIKSDVFGVTIRLEDRALADPPLRAVALVQDMRFASQRAREVWRALAAAGTEVTVFGRDLPAYVTDGVPGVSLEEDDPLVDIWAFLVVWSDGRAAGFAGNDVGHGHDNHGIADRERDFDLAESEDPEIVRRALNELGCAAP
jgi:hypothetical protein